MLPAQPDPERSPNSWAPQALIYQMVLFFGDPGKVLPSPGAAEKKARLVRIPQILVV